jgi:hypothetical protein
MNRFYVMSRHVIDKKPYEVVETIRSSNDEKSARKSAEEDVSIIKDMFGRAAWIEE